MKPSDYDIGIQALRWRAAEVKDQLLRTPARSIDARKYWAEEAKALRACAAKLLLLKKEAISAAASIQAMNNAFQKVHKKG